VELDSRFLVYSEQYILSLEVEARLVADLATTSIHPAALDYLSKITATTAGASSLRIDLDTGPAKAIATETNAMMAAVAN